MEQTGLDELPVAADDGTLSAVVERRAVERCLYGRHDETETAAAMGEAAVARAAPDEAIEDALDRMLTADLGSLPVVSSQGRLEGLLVYDNLRRVPNLVERVEDASRQRALAAGAGAANRHRVRSGLGGGGCLPDRALELQGPVYGLPLWVSWVDALAALLAFIAAGAVSSREIISIPLWAAASVGLAFAAGVAHAWTDGAWWTWVQLLPAVAFLLMAIFLGPRFHAVTLGRTSAVNA